MLSARRIYDMNLPHRAVTVYCYCMAGRMYASTKRLASAKEKISEYQSERADFFMQKRGEVTDV